jgi:nitrogen fixation protein
VTDPINAAAEHDRKQTENSKVYDSYKEEALTSIVEDLMAGGKKIWLKGWRLGLKDFLEEQADLAELVAAAQISRDWHAFDAEIERRLRRVLEDSDAVSDRCWELDQYERERAKERE